tara:strand:- start:647 stop:1654 length:1008 start_codon:yes stop_codon:yes gene_type:complete
MIKKIKKPYLIAEIGGNHEGDFKYAKKLIDLASKSGVDCIKLQIYSQKSLVNKNLDPDRYNHFKKFSLKTSDYIYLAKYIKSKGLDFSASIWDTNLINRFKNYVSFFKIGSGDLTAFDIIDKIIRTKKKIILSTGLSSIEQISRTIRFIKSYKYYQIKKKLILLHCTSLYPNQFKDVNLITINQLNRVFGLEVGYSDHCIDDSAILLAIQNGVRVIEFHFTDNKFRNFRDHQLSLNYDDVISLNNKIKKYNSILGQSNKKVLPEEKKQKHHISFRRGLYLNKFKQKGEIIKKADLVTLRPLKGICASQFFRVVGKKTKRNLKPYNPLSLKNFYGN